MATRKIKKVLAAVPYTGWHMDELKKMFAPAEVIKVDKNDTAFMSKTLETADVAIFDGDITEQILEEGTNLKWIHCDHAGLNLSSRPEIFERNIILTGSAGRSAPVMAEHVFFFVFSLAYDVKSLIEQQKKGIWRGIPGYDKRKGIYSKTIGIVGVGNNGREVAKRAKSFNMYVLGYDRCFNEMPENFDEIFSYDKGENVNELLKRSDFVVLTVSLSDETYHMIDDYAFDNMKSSSYLINMARGSIVDEEALIRALENGSIAGAGFDTFKKEPLPPDSPLWRLENMLITPHITPQMPDRTARSLEIICENIERYRQGEDLCNQLKQRDIYTQSKS